LILLAAAIIFELGTSHILCLYDLSPYIRLLLSMRTYEGLQILRYPNDTPIQIHDDGVFFSGKKSQLLAHFLQPQYVASAPI
jgi:hypothetical protein